ncbi:hypothetical protein RHGRI_009586 [Rhododendron griersonianum]|uniref:Uncharacterized protein n=1 Tax=Rhododendron griersonianum TaxID=479676 RepID=A0AAV6KFY9_9ERIC|nr:hypothetical protein RHGRI_009586 [Rhododendron griersonianum]
MSLKSFLVFSFLVLVLNANYKLKKVKERNSLVRDISAAMEKAGDSFEKFNETIQRIADDQAKIERTIRSLVEKIERQQQLLQFAVAGGF